MELLPEKSSALLHKIVCPQETLLWEVHSGGQALPGGAIADASERGKNKKKICADVCITHATNRVEYHAASYPRATFIYAWGLEMLADALVTDRACAVDRANDRGPVSSPVASSVGESAGETTIASKEGASEGTGTTEQKPASAPASLEKIVSLRKNLDNVETSHLVRIIDLYRQAQMQLTILCGASHEFATSPKAKERFVKEVMGKKIGAALC